jgi:hypothetical protein
MDLLKQIERSESTSTDFFWWIKTFFNFEDLSFFRDRFFNQRGNLWSCFYPSMENSFGLIIIFIIVISSQSGESLE